jgi:hypothetical protein
MLVARRSTWLFSISILIHIILPCGVSSLPSSNVQLYSEPNYSGDVLSYACCGDVHPLSSSNNGVAAGDIVTPIVSSIAIPVGLVARLYSSLSCDGPHVTIDRDTRDLLTLQQQSQPFRCLIVDLKPSPPVPSPSPSSPTEQLQEQSNGEHVSSVVSLYDDSHWRGTVMTLSHKDASPTTTIIPADIGISSVRVTAGFLLTLYASPSCEVCIISTRVSFFQS